MTPLARRSASLLMTVAVIACSTRTSGTGGSRPAALRAGVDSAADRLLTALRGDATDSLLALMADGVVIMPPNEAVLRGKEAVRAWYGQFVSQMHTTGLSVASREVFIGGDWATEVAGFEWTLVPAAGGAPVVDRGSYMQVWHHEPDGRWLFTREVWNSNAPPPAPSTGK